MPASPSEPVRPARPKRRQQPRTPATPSAGDEGVALFTPPAPAPAPPVELADDIDPLSRPWTPEAAMAPLAPVSPAELAAQQSVLWEPSHRSRLMTGVVLVAAVAAIFVVIASHLDLGHTSPPSFAVNDLAATKDASDTSVTVAGHFLPTAPRIDIEAAYIGASQGDQLTVQVLFAGSVFAEHTYDLSAGSGTVPAPLTPKDAATFKPGAYTINAIWHGSVVRTAQFTVDAAALPSAQPAASADA